MLKFINMTDMILKIMSRIVIVENMISPLLKP